MFGSVSNGSYIMFLIEIVWCEIWCLVRCIVSGICLELGDVFFFYFKFIGMFW